jgi:hypothetical protein
MANKSLPVDLQDATALAEVESATWRAVLDASGENARLQGETVTWDRLRVSLAESEYTDALADALETVVELGSDQGRELLIDTAGDLQIALANPDLSARELIARTWVQSRTDDSVRAVLVRAKVHIGEIRQHRHYREFAAGDGPVLPDFDKEKMQSALATWFNENQDANVVNVFPYERDGEWYWEIIKGDPLKRLLVVKDKNLSLLEIRPASSDVIRYDPKTKRIGIATRSSRLLQTYRSLFGKLVANEEAFFTNENICSLAELQKRGREIFDQHFSGIVRVDVVELRWRRGDRDKIWVHGRDCFKVLSDLGAQLTEGGLTDAKLTVSFAGGGRHGHVSLRTPNQIVINAGVNRELIERMLDQVGIRGTFGDDDVVQDFWSRYPWRMPESTYRRVLPGEFDRLLREKTIRPTVLESVAHPDHPAATGVLQVVNVDRQTTIGASEDPAIPSRTLTSSDIAGYEIDYGKIARDVAGALQLEGNTTEIESGLWLLGRRGLTPTTTIAAFLATRAVKATTAAVVQAASPGATPVLLYPKCCSCHTSLQSVGCALPAGPHEHILGGIVQQLHLENDVEPHVYMGEDFIIDIRRGQAWFRGALLSELKPDTHPFKLLRLLASTPGCIVSKESINNNLSPSRMDDLVAKQAKSDLLKIIKNGLTAAGITNLPDLNKIVAPKSPGYLLQTSARILS